MGRFLRRKTRPDLLPGGGKPGESEEVKGGGSRLPAEKNVQVILADVEPLGQLVQGKGKEGIVRQVDQKVPYPGIDGGRLGGNGAAVSQFTEGGKKRNEPAFDGHVPHPRFHIATVPQRLDQGANLHRRRFLCGPGMKLIAVTIVPAPMNRTRLWR
jgi:hypothetical protein